MPEVKIGLETHIQLDTSTKLFCGCPNEEADDPNTHTCPTCLGHPGSKPRTNRAVIDAGIQAGLALNCDTADKVILSRKTYFYPDMAKNFQITQYEEPIAADGTVDIGKKEIGITRAHIEEDPAKLVHKGGDMETAEYTLVDYNRAGTPLLEVVTEPDFESPGEAREFLKKLVRIMEYLGVYDRDAGTVRSDANISIEGGNRVEVKNITGTAEVEKALEYEIRRQQGVLDKGDTVERETRTYDSEDGVTKSMRTKEEEQDYGYIFEPDLVTVDVSEQDIEEARESLPEMPDEKQARFVEEYREYDISGKMVESLVTEATLADDFEELATEHDPQLTAAWMTGELKKTLNYHDVTYKQLNEIAGDRRFLWSVMNDALTNLESGEAADRGAERFIRKQVENALSEDVDKIEVREDGSRVIKMSVSGHLELSGEFSAEYKKTGSTELKGYVEEVLGENPDAVEDYRDGKEDALNFLVGQVMGKSGGSADPKEVRGLLEEALED